MMCTVMELIFIAKSIIGQLSLSYYSSIYLLVFVTVRMIFQFKILCILKNKLDKSLNSFAFVSFRTWPQPQRRCHHKPSNVQYKNKCDQTRKFLKYNTINKRKNSYIRHKLNLFENIKILELNRYL